MLAVMNRVMDYGSRIVIRVMDDTESQQWIIYPGRKVYVASYFGIWIRAD